MNNVLFKASKNISYYTMILSGIGSLPLPLLFLPLFIIFYLVWIWVFDDDICKKGGRRINFIRNLKIWKLASNYFPVQLIPLSGVDLDPKKNYLFCGFPHGIYAAGLCITFGTSAVGFNKQFPHHRPHILTLKQNFKIPILRDILLAFGMCSASAKSIKWLMTSNGGGNIAVLVVGGSEETFYSQPGTYHLVLKNRKGFAKQALQHGCPLVPVFSFGETDLFDQFHISEHSIIRQIQHLIKRLTGFPAILPLGRTFFRLPVIPKRKPITVISIAYCFRINK